MSIVACINVHDAVVFGADSITTITGTNEDGALSVLKSYRHAQKLYQMSDQLAAATWGSGNIGGRSIRSFVAEYARSLDENNPAEVSAVAQGLLGHIREAYVDHYGAQTSSEIGVMVGGYSPGSELPEILEFTVPNNQAPLHVRADANFGASWRGVPGPFARLATGIDPRLRSRILGEFDADPERRSNVEAMLASYPLPLVFDGMPIQEAVDFVVFVLQTTINVCKFEAGQQACGGPLWVAAITKDEFQWIRKPSLGVGEPT